MANLKYLLDPRAKNPFISVRLYQGKKIDAKRKLHIQLDHKCWNAEKQSVRNLIECKDRDEINAYLRQLQDYLLTAFNGDYKNGVDINSSWLQRKIDIFNNREHENAQGKNPEVYLLDYAELFMRNLKNKVNRRTGKVGVSPNTMGYYRNVVNKLQAYEDYSGRRIAFAQLTHEFTDSFMEFLRTTLNLGVNHVGRLIPSVKTIAMDARSKGVRVHPGIESLEGFTQELPVIFLDDDELRKVSYHPFSDPELCTARDWMIIGCWTGQRVSDLLNMDPSMIQDDVIRLKQQKTGNRVAIPIHPEVQNVLDRYNGKFPPTMSSQDFNVYVKKVCKACGLTQPIQGSKLDPETRRKVLGIYPKYELITAHCMRRSFCSNHYGNLPNAIIMSLSGHKSETEFLKYIGKTSEDHLDMVRKFWAESNKPVMSVTKEQKQSS